MRLSPLSCCCVLTAASPFTSFACFSPPPPFLCSFWSAPCPPCCPPSCPLQDVVQSFTTTIFAANGTDLSALGPGVLSFDYPTYYSQCRPSSCSWTYQQPPQFIPALTTSLGLASGLQTVLMLLIGKGLNFLPCFKKKQSSSSNSTDAAALEDSEEGEVTLGRPSRSEMEMSSIAVNAHALQQQAQKQDLSAPLLQQKY